MKKKKILIVILITLILLFIIIAVLGKSKNQIPNDYIAVFHGGIGEITYETYIYKEDNGHSNYGFKYINVTISTKSWGSTESNSKITKKGTVQWTDDVFTIAKENKAYDYVKLPNDNKTYTIEEYANIFLMN